MSLKPLKETVELWHRINNATSLEESLKSGNMSSFLMLEDSAEAIAALNTQVDSTMADLKALDGSIPKEMANTKKAVQAAMSAVAELRLKASPKIKIFDLGDPVKKASKVMADAASLGATIVSAGQTIMGSMNDFQVDIKSTESLESTLNAAREANPDSKIPDNKAFLGAVTKSWQPPQGVGNAIKGFLGAIVYCHQILQLRQLDALGHMNAEILYAQTPSRLGSIQDDENLRAVYYLTYCLFL